MLSLNELVPVVYWVNCVSVTERGNSICLHAHFSNFILSLPFGRERERETERERESGLVLLAFFTMPV